MTWWRDQLAQHGTGYAIAVAGGAVLWVFRNVFRNMLIMQQQTSQIADLRGDIKSLETKVSGDIKDLHTEIDATNRRINELLQFLAGQHGSTPINSHKSHEDPHV